MVRVISSGFSTPRSRHSSGEDMIDRFAAMKALSALNENEKLYMYKDRFGSGNLVIDSNTDTNDSFSGADSEEEIKSKSKGEKIMEEKHSNQDPAVLKKERRKERNKLSAQNYRQRRRQQASTAQKTLDALESHHKLLLEKVRQLEAEKHIVEEYLKSCVKIPWCPHHHLPSPANPPPPPQPPTIPENMPLATVYSNDNMASTTTTTLTVPQNMKSDACADVNVNFTFNTMIMNTNFTTANFNNNTANTTVPKDPFPAGMETESNNNNMPLCMSGTSSQPSSGSSVS